MVQNQLTPTAEATKLSIEEMPQGGIEGVPFPDFPDVESTAAATEVSQLIRKFTKKHLHQRMTILTGVLIKEMLLLITRKKGQSMTKFMIKLLSRSMIMK